VGIRQGVWDVILQPADRLPRRARVGFGSRAVTLRTSICFPVYPQKQTSPMGNDLRPVSNAVRPARPCSVNH
jgi:hypothetical protein